MNGLFQDLRYGLRSLLKNLQPANDQHIRIDAWALSSTFVGTGLHILLGRLPGMARRCAQAEGFEGAPGTLSELGRIADMGHTPPTSKILQPAADGGSADLEVRAVKSDPNCFALEVGWTACPFGRFAQGTCHPSRPGVQLVASQCELPSLARKNV